MLVAGGWFAAIVLGERTTRRWFASRSSAWLVSYLALGSVALLAGVAWPPGGTFNIATLAGLALAVVGYPLGRFLTADRTGAPPREPVRRELTILGLIVAPAEELIWGAIVEPVAGIPATATLFAVKHPLVDGRWRRCFGLFLFWLGLGLVRAWSWPAALALHVGVNAAGVLVGHRFGHDQF